MWLILAGLVLLGFGLLHFIKPEMCAYIRYGESVAPVNSTLRGFESKFTIICMRITGVCCIIAGLAFIFVSILVYFE